MTNSTEQLAIAYLAAQAGLSRDKAARLWDDAFEGIGDNFPSEVAGELAETHGVTRKQAFAGMRAAQNFVHEHGWPAP